MNRHRSSSFLLVSILAAGCATDHATVEDFPYDGDGKSDIGGVEALGSSLNAIGTVGMMDGTGAYQFFCSASLIGPTTVLTAKHCAEVLGGALNGMKYVNLVPIYFAIGPDAKAPLRLVEAVAADLSPLDEGGFVGLGNDVAIYHLAEAVTDVKPLKVADIALAQGDVGKRFVGIGFGAKDVFEDLTGQLQAHRKMGSKTLQALSGKSFELMLGSIDAFLDQLAFVYGRDVVNQYRDSIQTWYDSTVIYQGYELWAGYAPGDTQTCHGDSGGPMIGKLSDGSKAIFGVVSGGWFSRDLTCDYGTFYASIGDKTHELIASALTWTDPCSDGLTVQGRCEGTVAARCTGKWEGNRRATRVDCDDVGLACGQDAAGQVACVDPAQPPPAHVDPGAGMTAPTVTEVRTTVVEASRQALMQPTMQALQATKQTH